MERMHYIEDEDKLVIETVYDPTEVIEANKAERLLNGKAKLSDTRLVKVASIPEEHIEALRNNGFNLYSSDKDEVRRALCYIQDHEPDWMVVEGKPFALWRPKWR